MIPYKLKGTHMPNQIKWSSWHCLVVLVASYHKIVYTREGWYFTILICLWCGLLHSSGLEFPNNGDSVAWCRKIQLTIFPTWGVVRLEQKWHFFLLLHTSCFALGAARLYFIVVIDNLKSMVEDNKTS